MSAAFSAHLAKVKRMASITNMKDKTEHATKCVVCGARLRGFHFGANDTCDSTCTRAKHGNRTRGEQQNHELHMEHQAWADEEHANIYERQRWVDRAGERNYNRPYMVAA